MTNLKPFELFYEAAEARNAKMVANLTRTAGVADRGAVSVIVAGGFHTAGMTRLLREKGFSYAVLSPKLTKIDSHNASDYLNAFVRERSPLAKLFSGEKLTVADSTQLLAVQPISKARAFAPAAALGLFTLLLAAVAANADDAAFQMVASAIAAISGVTTLVSLRNGVARLRVNGQTVDVGTGVKGETIGATPSGEPVQWQIADQSGPSILSVFLAVGVSLAILFGWPALLAALVSYLTILKMNDSIGAMKVGVGDKLFDHLGPPSTRKEIVTLSPERLWDIVKTRGYHWIHENLPYLPHNGSRVKYRLWNYLLSHSVEEIAADMKDMDGFTIAQLLENDFILKKYEHRGAKVQKILESLSYKKREEVYGAMRPGNYRRMLNRKETPIRSVAYVSSEFDGLYKTGGIGDVAKSYPKNLWGFGHDVSQLMPFYEGVGIEKMLDKHIQEDGWAAKELPEKVQVPMGGKLLDVTVIQVTRKDGPAIYLLKNPDYFGKATMGRNPAGALNPYYARDGWDEGFMLERFIFWSKANLIVMAALGSKGYMVAPDTLHLNDWMTGPMAPWMNYMKMASLKKFQSDKERNPWMQDMSDEMFMRMKDFFRNTSVVYTTHNAAYQGLFSTRFPGIEEVSWKLFQKIGLPADPYYKAGDNFSLEYHGVLNFGLGIQSAEISFTVSPEHAEELASGEYPYMPEVFERLTKEGRFFGVANGVDADRSPRELKNIIPYGSTDMHQVKPLNKVKLLKEVGLSSGDDETDKKKFVVGVVARMEAEKGFWSIRETIEKHLTEGRDITFVILGNGKEDIQNAMLDLKRRFPKNVSVDLKFNPDFANLVLAGSDAALVPSGFEPSGLTHFMAMAVGTVPIVAPSGGLRIIVDGSNGAKRPTGFVMKNKTAAALTEKVQEAFTMFHNDHAKWRWIMENDMDSDFTWPNSVDKILDVYDRAPHVTNIWTGKQLPVSIPVLSAEPVLPRDLLLIPVYRLASWLFPVFQDEDGLKRYKASLFGAPLFEAIAVIFPLSLGLFAIGRNVPVIAAIGPGALVYASIIVAVLIFLALHYLQQDPDVSSSHRTRAGPWYLNYRGIGAALISRWALTVVAPAIILALSTLPPALSQLSVSVGQITAEYIVAGTGFFAGALSTIPRHARWNVESPRTLSAEPAAQAIIGDELAAKLLAYEHPLKHHGFGYTQENIAFFNTDPGAINPDPERFTQWPKGGPLSKFLTGNAEIDAQTILWLMPPFSYKGERSFNGFYTRIYDDFSPPSPIPDRAKGKVRTYENVTLGEGSPYVVDYTNQQSHEREATRQRTHEAVRKGKHGYVFTTAGAGKRFFRNDAAVSDKAMTKGNVAILDVDLGDLSGFKMSIEAQLLRLRKIAGFPEKPVSVTLATKDTSLDFLQKDVERSPFLTDIDEKTVNVDYLPGHSMPLVKNGGGVAWIRPEELDKPADSPWEAWMTTPGAFVMFQSAIMSGRFLKWIDDGVDGVMVAAAEDLGAGMTEDMVRDLKARGATGMFLLVKRDITYHLQIEGSDKTIKAVIRGGQELIKIDDDEEYGVQYTSNGHVVMATQDGLPFQVPVLVKKNQPSTKLKTKFKKIEFEKGGVPMKYMDNGVERLAILDGHQFPKPTAEEDRRDKARGYSDADVLCAKTPIYNTNQFVFLPPALLEVFGFAPADNFRQYRDMLARKAYGEIRAIMEGTMAETMDYNKDSMVLFEGSSLKANLWGNTLSDVMRLSKIKTIFGVIDREAKMTDYGFAAFKNPGDVHDEIRIMDVFSRAQGGVKYRHPPQGFDTRTAAAMKYVADSLVDNKEYWPNLWDRDHKDDEGKIVFEEFPSAKVIFDFNHMMETAGQTAVPAFWKDRAGKIKAEYVPNYSHLVVRRVFETFHKGGYHLILKKNFSEQTGNHGIVVENGKVTVFIHAANGSNHPVPLGDLTTALEDQFRVIVQRIEDRPSQVLAPAPVAPQIDPASEALMQRRRLEVNQREAGLSLVDLRRTGELIDLDTRAPVPVLSLTLSMGTPKQLDDRIKAELIEPLKKALKDAGLADRVEWRDENSLRVFYFLRYPGKVLIDNKTMFEAAENVREAVNGSPFSPLPVRGLYFDSNWALRLNVGRYLGDPDTLTSVRGKLEKIRGDEASSGRNEIGLFRIVKALNASEFRTLNQIVNGFADINFGSLAPKNLRLSKSVDWKGVPVDGGMEFPIQDGYIGNPIPVFYGAAAGVFHADAQSPDISAPFLEEWKRSWDLLAQDKPLEALDRSVEGVLARNAELINEDGSAIPQSSVSLIAPASDELTDLIKKNLVTPLEAELGAELAKKIAIKNRFVLTVMGMANDYDGITVPHDVQETAIRVAKKVLSNRQVESPDLVAGHVYITDQKAIVFSLGLPFGFRNSEYEKIRKDIGRQTPIGGMKPEGLYVTIGRIHGEMSPEQHRQVVESVRKFANVILGAYKIPRLELIYHPDWHQDTREDEGKGLLMATFDVVNNVIQVDELKIRGTFSPTLPNPPAAIPGLSSWVAKHIFGVTISLDDEIYEWAPRVEEVLFSVFLIGVPMLMAFLIAGSDASILTGFTMVFVRALLFFITHKWVFEKQANGRWGSVKASFEQRLDIAAVGFFLGAAYFLIVAFAFFYATPAVALAAGLFAFPVVSKLHQVNQRIGFAIAAIAFANGDNARPNVVLTERSLKSFDGFASDGMPDMLPLGLAGIAQTKPSDLFTVSPVAKDSDDEKTRSSNARNAVVYSIPYQGAINARINAIAELSASTEKDAKTNIETALRELAALTGVKNALGAYNDNNGIELPQLQALALAVAARNARLSPDLNTQFFENLIEKTTRDAVQLPSTPTPADADTSRNDFALYSFADLQAVADPENPGLVDALGDIKRLTALQAAGNFGDVFVSVVDGQQADAIAWFNERIPGFDAAKSLRFIAQNAADPLQLEQDLKDANRDVRKIRLFPLGQQALQANWNLGALTPEELVRFTIELISLDGQRFSLNDHFERAKQNIEMALQAA